MRRVDTGVVLSLTIVAESPKTEIADVRPIQAEPRRRRKRRSGSDGEEVEGDVSVGHAPGLPGQEAIRKFGQRSGAILAAERLALSTTDHEPSEPTKSPGIFLSHTWADKEFVRRLARDLEAAGARVWLDEAEILVGDSLIEKIRAGIDEMDYLAVVLSPESVESEWVKREVDIAMNQEIEGRRVKVLPILYRNCEIPGFLKGKLYADFTSDEGYELALSQIIARLGPRSEPVATQRNEPDDYDPDGKEPEDEEDLEDDSATIRKVLNLLGDPDQMGFLTLSALVLLPFLWLAAIGEDRRPEVGPQYLEINWAAVASTSISRDTEALTLLLPPVPMPHREVSLAALGMDLIQVTGAQGPLHSIRADSAFRTLNPDYDAGVQRGGRLWTPLRVPSSILRPGRYRIIFLNPASLVIDAITSGDSSPALYADFEILP